MFFLSTIRMSFANLRANAMRTFLTMLGVIIGITSIIALLAIGQGVTDSVIDQLAGLGGNRATVSIEDTTVKKGFTETELAQFAALDGVEGVAPILSGSRVVTLMPGQTNSKFDGVHTSGRRIMGVNDFYFSTYTKNAGMLYGRSISTDDVRYRTNVCVLGYELWQKLYGNYSPVGETILVHNTPCTIIGVMNQLVGIDVSGNNAVVVPYTTASQKMEMGLPSSFDVVISSSKSTDEVIESIKNLCAKLLGSAGGREMYAVFNQEEILDMVLTITDLVLGMLAGIAVIALVVGGIGIMNIMLASVYERRKEIGTRRALGAQKGDILFQFLIETVFLTSMGGILGILLGVGISSLITFYANMPTYYSPISIIAALLISSFVGVLFGTYPAWKAAQQNPIDVLRSN